MSEINRKRVPASPEPLNRGAHAGYARIFIIRDRPCIPNHALYCARVAKVSAIRFWESVLGTVGPGTLANRSGHRSVAGDLEGFLER